MTTEMLNDAQKSTLEDAVETDLKQTLRERKNPQTIDPRDLPQGVTSKTVMEELSFESPEHIDAAVAYAVEHWKGIQ